MNIRKVTGVLLLFIVPIIGWVGLANAQSFRSGDTTTVDANETVNSSLFASGRTVDIAGTVDGDLYCAGVNVFVSGTVRGDVLCAGQTVTLSGKVEGDVRLAGQTVTLSGQVGGSASVATSAFSLDSQARIDRDLSAASSDMTLNGEVGRDIALAGASVVLNNKVGRNVNASVENLRLNGQTDIGGGLFYTSNRDAVIAAGANIAGDTKRTQPQQTKGTLETPFVTGMSFVFYLIFALLLLSLALVLLFPAAIHAISGQAVASPLKTLLVGFIAGLAVPVLIIVLMITVIGIPLALLLLGIWILILWLAGPVFSYYVGRLLLSRQTNQIFIMAFGALVVLVLLFVPILGFLVWLAAMWMGSGMILLEAFRRTPRPGYEIQPNASK